MLTCTRFAKLVVFKIVGVGNLKNRRRRVVQRQGNFQLFRLAVQLAFQVLFPFSQKHLEGRDPKALVFFVKRRHIASVIHQICHGLLSRPSGSPTEPEV